MSLLGWPRMMLGTVVVFDRYSIEVNLSYLIWTRLKSSSHAHGQLVMG